MSIYSLLIGAIICISNISCISQKQNSEILINSIPQSNSSMELSFDFDIDSNGVIHLVSSDDSAGVRYFKFQKSDNTWLKPVQLGLGKTVSNPKIFINNNIITIIWNNEGLNIQQSLDNGDNWSNNSGKILSQFPVQEYRFSYNKNELTCIFSNRNGLFIVRSDNQGITWEQPAQIYHSTNQDFSPSELSYSNKELYSMIVWAEKDEIYYIFSDNRGESWSTQKFIPANRMHINSVFSKNYLFQYLKLAQSNESFFLFYEERGLFLQKFEILSQAWQPAQMINEKSIQGLDIINEESKLHAIWVDNRFRKKQWWAHIPFHQVFTGSADPNWRNNDLFYSIIDGEHVKNPIRITKDLSYVSWLIYNSDKIGIKKRNSEIYLFWSGISKAGRNFNEYNLPYEIFYTIYKENNK